MRSGPRILLSEASSLSAREAITAFGVAGHRVHVVTSEAFCLGRFSRFVDRVHPGPASGIDPAGYLEAVLSIVAQQRIDALIPVHEQAYLFAAARHQMPATLAVALADFAAFEQVQSKAAFSALLNRLGIPQPATAIIRSPDDLMAERAYPIFLKAAFGTASTEVLHIDGRKQLAIARDAGRYTTTATRREVRRAHPAWTYGAARCGQAAQLAP